jgi:predicted DNA-binding protein
MQETTVSTRVDEEMAEKLQTVADAESVSKSDYLRSALEEKLQNDHEELTDADVIKSEINELERQIEQVDADGKESGLPDPLGIFR